MSEEKDSKYKRFLENNKELIDKKFLEANEISDFPDYARNHIEDFPLTPRMPGQMPLSNMPVGPGDFDFPPKIPQINDIEKEFIKLLKNKVKEKQMA
ncbi:MAG: hypothetical protein PHW96_00625 [Candidatus Nanoarchaeia archaeon]|nr:hypothetical protein [Candidatus Nanoarchaeia archaeon]